MIVIPTPFPDILIFESQTRHDSRGWFMESFNQREFNQLTAGPYSFVQDNHSYSKQGVVRGLHYQLPPMAQGKLIRVVVGAVWSVAVDIRAKSSTFQQWFGTELTAINQRQLWIPPGFAHGFVALHPDNELLYKTTAHYSPSHERRIHWNDPTLHIDWPLPSSPLLTEKDEAAPPLSSADLFL